MLEENRTRLVVDVRTILKSRHNPQFGNESLEKSLLASGLSYLHMPSLGELRNESFRGFADYMQTEEFDDAVRHLQSIAGETRVAIMSAEAVHGAATGRWLQMLCSPAGARFQT